MVQWRGSSGLGYVLYTFLTGERDYCEHGYHSYHWSILGSAGSSFFISLAPTSNQSPQQVSKQKLNDLSLSISLPLLAVLPVARVRKTHSYFWELQALPGPQVPRIPARQSWIQILSDSLHFHCADGETGGLRVNNNSNNNKNTSMSLLSVTDDLEENSYQTDFSTKEKC